MVLATNVCHFSQYDITDRGMTTYFQRMV
jgi:hypothetical protein